MVQETVLSTVLFALSVFVYSLCYAVNYKLVCDDFDQTGGKASSTNFELRVSAAGQPSTIGISQSDNYTVKAGYVYASFVRCGDANGDGIIDIGDIVLLINYVFYGGPAPAPLEAGDVNCDGIVDIGDIVYLINYVFYGGPPPTCY